MRAATCSREATESELSDCKEESQALKQFPDTLVRVRPTAQKLIQSINVITVNNTLAITVMTWTLIFRDFNIKQSNIKTQNTPELDTDNYNMEDSLSIIEEEMEQLEVSTGEMTNIDTK